MHTLSLRIFFYAHCTPCPSEYFSMHTLSLGIFFYAHQVHQNIFLCTLHTLSLGIFFYAHQGHQNFFYTHSVPQNIFLCTPGSSEYFSRHTLYTRIFSDYFSTLTKDIFSVVGFVVAGVLSVPVKQKVSSRIFSFRFFSKERAYCNTLR